MQKNLKKKDWNPSIYVLIWEYSVGVSNEYQHDKVEMVFKNICVFVLWMKVASALEGLIMMVLWNLMEWLRVGVCQFQTSLSSPKPRHSRNNRRLTASKGVHVIESWSTELFLMGAVRKINLKVVTRWHYHISFVAILKIYINQYVVSINGVYMFYMFENASEIFNTINRSCL